MNETNTIVIPTPVPDSLTPTGRRRLVRQITDALAAVRTLQTLACERATTLPTEAQAKDALDDAERLFGDMAERLAFHRKRHERLLEAMFPSAPKPKLPPQLMPRPVPTLMEAFGFVAMDGDTGLEDDDENREAA